MQGMVQDLSTSKDFQQSFENEHPDGKITLAEGTEDTKVDSPHLSKIFD